MRWNSRSSLSSAFGFLADDEAAGELHVLLGEGFGDVLRRDAVGGHARRQQVDPDSAVAATAEAHLAHAVDGLQALLETLGRTG
jgi:hypothetical protein